MTLWGGGSGGCDEDKDLIGGAIGRDIVVCGRSLRAPQREGTIGCSANLRPIGEQRARRGHNPGTIGSNTASAGARTDACAAALGPTDRATDRSISSTYGSDTIIPLTGTIAG
jgi:hypothetical protein